MKKIKWITLITVAGLLWGSTWVNAEYVIDKKETLRGIKSMEVVIESLEPDIIRLGLTREMLKTDVELKLRLAGIKVVTEKNLDEPYLYVCVNIYSSKNPPVFSFNVSVQFNQLVYLGRDKNISFDGVTWSDGCTGIVGTKEMSKFIRDAVKLIVDKFLNDYLSVNPIQPGTPQKKN